MRRHGVERFAPGRRLRRGNGHLGGARWWLLRYFGHPDVALLDGGYAAWIAAGLPVAAGDEPSIRARGLRAHARAACRCSMQPARRRWRRAGVLVDARAPERFRGETEPVDPGGGPHPRRTQPAGAADARVPTAHFLPPDALRERFAAVGVRPGKPVAVYCGSGVVATEEIFAHGGRRDRRRAVRGLLERVDHRPEPADRDRAISLKRRWAGAPPNADPLIRAEFEPLRRCERVARRLRLKRRVPRQASAVKHVVTDPSLSAVR